MIKIFVIYRIGLDDESRIIAAYKYKDDAIAAQNRFKLVENGYTMIIEIPLYDSTKDESKDKINS